MLVDAETDAGLFGALDLSGELPLWREGEAHVFPCICNLCFRVIENGDDGLNWHGYGNCVEITDEMWARWEEESKCRS